MIFAELVNLAKKVNNYDVDATGGGLWTDTTHYKATVPSAKRWFLIGGIVNRDVSSSFTAYAYDSAGNAIYVLDAQAAGTGKTGFPNYTRLNMGAYAILDGAEYIELAFAVAQGATAYASCCVLEIDV